MPFARWQANIVNMSGDVQAGALVTVRAETGGAPLAAIFSDRDGTIPQNNPFFADAEGFAAFFVAGGAYRIDASLPGFTRTLRYVAIGTAAEHDIDNLPFARLDADNEFTAGNRFVGPVDQTATGTSRLDLGVQVGSPRIVLENADTAVPFLMDVTLDHLRWYKPGIPLMSLDIDGNLNLHRYTANTAPIINSGGAVVGSAGARMRAIVFHIDGGGINVTAGQKTGVVVPFNGEIQSWTIVANATGSIAVGIRKATYAAFPSVTSISGGSAPTLSSARKNQDPTASTFTKGLTAGDILVPEVVGATTVLWATITINVRVD